MYTKPCIFTDEDIENMIELLCHTHIASAAYKKAIKRTSFGVTVLCIITVLNVGTMLLNVFEVTSLSIFTAIISIFFILLYMKPTQNKILRMNIKKILTKIYAPRNSFKCDENAIYGAKSTFQFSDINVCVSYQQKFYCLIMKNQQFLFLPENIYQDIKQEFLFKHTNIKFAVENQPFDILSYFPDNS